MGASKPIVLKRSGRVFKTKKALKEYIKGIRTCSIQSSDREIRGDARGDVLELVAALFGGTHYNHNKKLHGEIVRVYTGPRPDKGAKAINYIEGVHDPIRVTHADGMDDGLVMDDLVDHAHPSFDHKTTIVKHFQKNARKAVNESVLSFRKTHTSEDNTVVCSASNQRISSKQAHADHDQTAFNQLLLDFLLKNDIFIDEVMKPDRYGWKLDSKFASAWLEFHDNSADLKMLKTELNLQKGGPNLMGEFKKRVSR